MSCHVALPIPSLLSFRKRCSKVVLGLRGGNGLPFRVTELLSNVGGANTYRITLKDLERKDEEAEESKLEQSI